MNEYPGHEGNEAEGLLANPEVKELVEFRGIQPEDYSLLEKLSAYSKAALISNWHSYFLENRERSASELQAGLDYLATLPPSDANRELAEMYRTYLEICQKYDWATANNINRVLERLDK